MSLIAWILLGFVTGVAANLVDPRPSTGGALGAIVLGISGAVVGGFISNLLLGAGVTGFNLTSFIVSFLGAMLLLFIGRAFRRAS